MKLWIFINTPDGRAYFKEIFFPNFMIFSLNFSKKISGISQILFRERFLEIQRNLRKCREINEIFVFLKKGPARQQLFLEEISNSKSRRGSETCHNLRRIEKKAVIQCVNIALISILWLGNEESTRSGLLSCAVFPPSC